MGIAVGYGILKWLRTLLPPYSFAREVDITMDTRVLLFALAISAVTGLLFGIAPALHAASLDLANSMKEGGRGSVGSATWKRIRDLLIVVEVALAFVLLVGSGLMMRSFVALMTVDPGLDATNILTMGLPIDLINGRLAKRDFPNEDPIGQRILIQEIVPGKHQLGPEIPWEIVGIVRDEKVTGLADDRSVVIYVSNEQSPMYIITLIVKASVDPLTLQSPITTAIHAVSKGQAVSNVRTLDLIKDEAVGSNRLQSTLMAVFGMVALLLATVGIYGVISYSVAQRTYELGVRAALGASPKNLLWTVLSRGLLLTSLGLAIGLVAALNATRLMTTLLYGVGPRDPATVLAVAVIIIVVCLAACYVPSRKARRVDPVVAFRCE